MKRRDLLATVGAGMVGFAGCSGVLGGDEMPEETLTPVELSPTETTTATPTPPDGTGTRCDTGDAPYAIDGPATNDLPEPVVQFEELSCPTFSWAEQTVCYHTADLLRADIVLVGEKIQAFVRNDGDGGDIVSFALINRRAMPLNIQPTTWSILRSRSNGDGWQTVAGGDPGCTETLSPEQFHRWRLGIEQPVAGDAANETAAKTSLEPGVYMFVVPVFLPDGSNIVCAAPFSVQTFDLVTPTGPVETPAPTLPNNATATDSE